MLDNAIEIQFRSSNIKRYHIDPIIGEQNVGHHSYRVAQLVRYLTDDTCSRALICAALDHDVPEVVIGDMPFGVKKNLKLKELLDKVGDEYLSSLGLLMDLTDEEKVVLKTADILEAGLFGAEQMDMGNKQGQVILYRVLNTFKGKHIQGRTAALVMMLERSYLMSQGVPPTQTPEKEERDERIIIPGAH